MANLILTIGVTVLSFCVVIFFAIAFANAIESVIAKHELKLAMKNNIQIVKATKDDCCCHECCRCQECCHSHNVESVHDEEE